jgi:hypothetical protein
MDKAKRARKAEMPKRPSLSLRLRTPYLYPDPESKADYRRYFSTASTRSGHAITRVSIVKISLRAVVRLSRGNELQRPWGDNRFFKSTMCVLVK